MAYHPGSTTTTVATTCTGRESLTMGVVHTETRLAMGKTAEFGRTTIAMRRHGFRNKP